MVNAIQHYPDTRLFIAGQWRDGAQGRSLPVHNPATGEPMGCVACAEAADLDEAALASERGFALWSATPAVERGRILRGAAERLRERVDQVARWLTLEQGKPLAEARQEVLGGADFLDWAAAQGTRLDGRVVQPRQTTTLQLVVKDAIGPVAAFTPWNFPINQAVRKIGVALASGCSLVVKAAEETPAAPAALVQALVDAGLPAGVLNLVYGDPAAISSFLIAHPAIRKVSFTGSTAVGKQLAALAGQHMKRCTMELGGHAPVIVAADADVALAARTLAAAKFRNAGQICIAPTRFLVQREVMADFSEALADQAARLRIGDGLTEGVQMGPLANARRVEAMGGLVQDAVAQGANVLTGGQRLAGPGHFWQPTVLAQVPRQARVFNEEPFGPVAALQAFDALSEAVAEANRLPYGLSAYAFTGALSTAHALARSVRAGMLWINQAATPWPELPFGGLGDSGHGSEGGPEAFEAYLATRTVVMNAA